MASISVSNIGSTSFSAQLTGLQIEGVDYTRRCQWTVRDSSNNTLDNVTEYITQGSTKGITHTFTGLSSNTTYTASCLVYRNDTGEYLAGFSVEVTTSSGGSGGDEPDEPEVTWSIYKAGSRTNFNGELQTQLILIPNRICRYAISFANSGTAIFYTSGTVIDTYGYLTDIPSDVITADGEPNVMILDEADSYGDDVNDGYEDGLNFSITHQVTAGTTYYIWVRSYSGEERGNVTLHIIAPDGSSTQWTWSDKAYNAFANNGDTRDVPYTEWNDFVNFVGEKTGYPVSSALMGASDTTLYAIQFNAVRYAIGSVNTFQNGTNSIKDHYTETGQWDMSPGEVVKGQYFIDLTTYLNDI